MQKRKEKKTSYLFWSEEETQTMLRSYGTCKERALKYVMLAKIAFVMHLLILNVHNEQI